MATTPPTTTIKTTADSPKLQMIPPSPVGTNTTIVGQIGSAITNQASVVQKHRGLKTMQH